MISDLLQKVSFQGHGCWYWTSHTQWLLQSVSAAEPVRIWGMQGWTEEEAGRDKTAVKAQLLSLGWGTEMELCYSTLGWEGSYSPPSQYLPIVGCGQLRGGEWNLGRGSLHWRAITKFPIGQQPSFSGAGRSVFPSLGYPEQPTSAITTDGSKAGPPLTTVFQKKGSVWVKLLRYWNLFVFNPHILSFYNFLWCSHFTHWQTSGWIKKYFKYLMF